MKSVFNTSCLRELCPRAQLSSAISQILGLPNVTKRNRRNQPGHSFLAFAKSMWYICLNKTVP
jgi:hypothetical protein